VYGLGLETNNGEFDFENEAVPSPGFVCEIRLLADRRLLVIGFYGVRFNFLEHYELLFHSSVF